MNEDLEDETLSFEEREDYFAKRGKYEKGKPVLRGFLTQYTTAPNNALLVVWCPYCAKYHHHGWDLVKDKKPIHREANCRPESNSPLKEKGYWVQPFEYKRRKDFTIKNKFPKK